MTDRQTHGQFVVHTAHHYNLISNHSGQISIYKCI